MEIIAVVSSLASGITQYMGAQQQAKAQRQAADSAIAMGKYNAQIDVNNMVAEQGDLKYIEAAQQTSQLSSEIADSGRQLGYSYQRGQANRDLTLRTAANNATQFRNQAKQTQLAGTANLFGSLGQTYTMGKDLKVFN